MGLVCQTPGTPVSPHGRGTTAQGEPELQARCNPGSRAFPPAAPAALPHGYSAAAAPGPVLGPRSGPGRRSGGAAAAASSTAPAVTPRDRRGLARGGGAAGPAPLTGAEDYGTSSWFGEEIP
ncbi:hypothetical protein Q9966_011413 [Columba livia]|nr:hypothetical protein Q9966_011413 [Columba livia]